MTNLKEELRATAQKVVDERRKVGQQYREQHEKDLQETAKLFAQPMIDLLPERMRVEASRGATSILVMSEPYRLFTDHQKRVASIITLWAHSQGLHVSHTAYPASGDDFQNSESLWISWN